MPSQIMSCTHRPAVCSTSEIITCSSALKCTSSMALSEFLDLNLWLEHACILHAARLVCWRLKNLSMWKSIIGFLKEDYRRGILTRMRTQAMPPDPPLHTSECILPLVCQIFKAGRLISKNNLDSPSPALQVHAVQPSKANNSPSIMSPKHRDVRRPDLPLMPCSSMCA